jgi:hypothetical protein
MCHFDADLELSGPFIFPAHIVAGTAGPAYPMRRPYFSSHRKRGGESIPLALS